MWPFDSQNSEADLLIRRINKVLSRLGKGSATILDFSASRLAEGLALTELTERDFEELRNSIESEDSKVSKLQKIELVLFSSVLLIYLNLAKEISLFGFSLSASQNLLAILIFVLSTVQIGIAIARNDLEVRKKVLKLVLLSCSHLDPSGMRRLLIVEKIDASSPWLKAVRQSALFPGWRYIAISFSMLPILLHIFVFIIAIPLAIVMASYSLAKENDWGWIYSAIFASAILGVISRFLLFPLMHFTKINYTEWNMRRKFYEDADRYGITGALLILDDQVDSMARDAKLLDQMDRRNAAKKFEA